MNPINLRCAGFAIPYQVPGIVGFAIRHNYFCPLNPIYISTFTSGVWGDSTLCGIYNPAPDIVGFSIRHNYFYPLNPINLRCAGFAIPYQVPGIVGFAIRHNYFCPLNPIYISTFTSGVWGDCMKAAITQLYDDWNNDPVGTAACWATGINCAIGGGIACGIKQIF